MDRVAANLLMATVNGNVVTYLYGAAIYNQGGSMIIAKSLVKKILALPPFIATLTSMQSLLF